MTEQPKQTDHTPAWTLVGVALGFAMPLCACGVLAFAMAAGFVGLASGLPTADTDSGAGIGVVKLDGPIFMGEGIGAASDSVIADIEWMVDNDDVKAIVIQANSPGGGVTATDAIWNRLSEVDKPVYISIDGTCASGCYYIAMAADSNQVYATPTSLIGSIGVISTFFNVEELADEIGVEVQIIATGENKDFGSPFRELTEEEITYWREQTEALLDTFISRVDAGRPNLTQGDIRELANGRVWVAPIAEDLGLIDGQLYPKAVLDHAAENADLEDDYRVIESPLEPSLLELLLDETTFGVSLPSAHSISERLQGAPLQYRYLGPYDGD